MEDVVTDRPSVTRRLTGWGAVLLAGAVLVLFVLGTWNPGDLVVLWRWFGDPTIGAVLFFALAFIASWLLAPVHNEAAQAGRLRWRIGFGIGTAAALIVSLLFGGLFDTAHRELARSGELRIMLIRPGTDEQRLHVWSGRGLGVRDAGDLGHPCGQTSVTFRSADRIRVSTVYGEFDLDLAPATGRPLDVLGPTCSG